MFSKLEFLVPLWSHPSTLTLVELIRVADLETCTPKSIRGILEAELNVDLSGQREKINEIINEAILKRLSEEAPAKDHAGTPSSVINTSAKSPMESDGEASDMADAFSDEDQLDDEELARRLQAEENSRGRLPRKAVVTKKTKARKLVRREPNPNNPFNRPLLLSEPLSRLLDGATELSRPQVVKQIWAYVKAHDLQDPNDKRILICDERMLPVFKKPTVSCFGMNKILSGHLKKKDDVTPVSKKPRSSKEEFLESETE